MILCPEDMASLISAGNLSPALKVIDVLESRGEAWIVGGAVRDALLGISSEDVDMACSLSPAETTRILESIGCKVIPTGIAHGTVTAICDGLPIEITTYRTDGAYSDGRHPDAVSPARSIEEDLARRDFTVNAIAWHPARGLVDPFGGCGDLDAGIIRCVGVPEQRFAEDALRILRALRFSSQLGFSIEDGTAKALRALKGRLDLLARERVAHEMERMLTGEYVLSVLLAYPDVLAQIIPEIEACVGCPQMTPYHCYDVWEHIARTVNAAPPTATVRWAALLHDIGKPPAHVITNGRSHFRGHAKLGLEIARRVTEELHMPRAQADAICKLVLHHDDDILLEEKSIRRFVNKMGSPELFYDLCDLKIADSDAHAPDHRQRGAQAEVLKDMLSEMLAAGEPFAVRDLAVNGRDIMALGMEEGPDVGRVLHTLFDGVADGTLPNDREVLLERASSLVDHSSAARNAQVSSVDASSEP